MKILEIDRKAVYANCNGIKITSRGTTQPVVSALSGFPKNIRRKIRKALYKNGFRSHAASK